MNTAIDKTQNPFRSRIKQFGSHVNLSNDGDLIFLIRTGLRLTQHQFAEKLGVGKNTPGNWEKRGQIGKSKKELILEKLKPELKKQGISVTGTLSSYEEKVDLYNQIREGLVPLWDQIFKVNHEDVSISSGYPGSVIEQMRVTIDITQKEIHKKADIGLHIIKSWTTRKSDPSTTIGRENAKAISEVFGLPEKLKQSFIEALGEARGEEFRLSDGKNLYEQIREWLLPPLKPITPYPSARPKIFIEYGGIPYQIEYALNNGNPVGIYGPLGMGKTTLLNEIAHRMLSDSKYPGGIIQISCPPNSTNDEIYQDILYKLYTDEDADNTTHENVRGWIKRLFQGKINEWFEWSFQDELQWTFDDKAMDDRPFLLVLDDVYSSEILKSLAEWLPETCSMLFSTQSQDVINDLQKNEQFACLDIPLPSPVDAAEILKSHIGLQQVRDEWATEHIVSILGYLPGALNLAGRLIAEGNSIEKIYEPEELDEKSSKCDFSKELLSYLAQKAYKALTSEAKKMFFQLGVFAPSPAAFTSKALQAVWNVSKEQQREICKELNRYGLLTYENSQASLFSIHPLFQEVALNELRGSDESGDEEQTKQVILAHASYYQELVCDLADFHSIYQERGQIGQARQNLLDLLKDNELAKSERTYLFGFAQATTYIESFERSGAMARTVLITKVLEFQKDYTSWFTLHLANAFLMAGHLENARAYYNTISKGRTGAQSFSKAHVTAFIGLGFCYASDIKYTVDDFGFKDSNFEEEMFDRAKQSLIEGEDLARSLRADELLFYAHCAIGDLYLKRVYSLLEWLKTFCHRLDSSEIRETLEDVDGLSFYAEMNYQKATELEGGNQKLKAIVERRLGDICLLQGGKALAIEHYEESKRHAKKSDHSLALEYASQSESALYHDS